MKSILSFLFCLAISFTMYGQSYLSDQVIIQYVDGTSPLDEQAVRDVYGITSTTNLGDGIELWDNLVFPLIFSENGQTEQINTIEELILHIGIQNGGDDNVTTRSNVQNGDLDFILELEELGALYDDGTFTPLPYCSAADNERLFVPSPSGGYQIDHDFQTKVVIIDQYIPGININTGNSIDNIGGTHGIKVHSVIDNILTQADIPNVEYYNITAFDDTGVGTTSSLIEAGEFIHEQYISNNWSSNDKVIVNFSANLIFPEEVNIQEVNSTLYTTWNRLFRLSFTNSASDKNIILISSAGNQGSHSNNVFPAGINFPSEISVAGTQNCFTQPWTGTNHDPVNYDIAAEASGVLTSDGVDYFLSNGTSFATAIVTAAVIQLFHKQEDSSTGNSEYIKELLLDLADEIPALASTVNQGKVLRINNYTPAQQGGGNNNGGIRPLIMNQSTSSLALTPTPNPFTENALITIELPQAGDLTITLHNSIGQRVHQEFIPNQQEMQELEWPTPQHLAPGTYILRVQAGESVAQTMLIKQ